MRIVVVAVDKDYSLFDVEGLRFWGRLKKGKNCYYLEDEKKEIRLRINKYYGNKLMEHITKQTQQNRQKAMEL